MRGRQLFLVTMAFTLSFSVWGLISGLAPRFKDLYGLSDVQTAIAVAVPIILGSLFRLPMGILADRYGGRVIFCALLAFAVVPAGAIALIHSYVALLIGGFFLGLAGSSFAVGVSFTNKWYPPEKQGLALGWRAPSRGRPCSGSSAWPAWPGRRFSGGGAGTRRPAGPPPSAGWPTSFSM